jgi:hypothetical protein
MDKLTEIFAETGKRETMRYKWMEQNLMNKDY